MSMVVVLAPQASAQNSIHDEGVASSESQAENRRLSENRRSAENLKLVTEVTERWRDWMASEPDLLAAGEMVFPNEQGELGDVWLRSKLQMASLIVNPDSAFEAMSETQYVLTIAQLVGQQIALGNLEIANEMIEEKREQVDLLSLLNDTASYAAMQGRPELLDWVDAQLAEIPELVSDAENPALGIQLDKNKVGFVASAARLELLRTTGLNKNAIQIEETAAQMRGIAGQFGDHFRGASVQATVIRLAALESWSKYEDQSSVAAVNAAIEKHPSLKPLANIAKAYSWTAFGDDLNSALTAELAPAWISRQNYRGRHEAAIAMVLQRDWTRLTQVRLLSRISTSLVSSDKDLAIQSAKVARALMNEALESDLNEQYWEVLETISELAVANQSIGDPDSAMLLLKKATQFWSERHIDSQEGDAESRISQLVSAHPYQLLALMEAIVVTDFDLSKLDPRLNELFQLPLNWGYAEMSDKFDAQTKNVRRFPGQGFERTIDTTKFLTGIHERPQEASIPEYYRWFDMQFWPQAVKAYRSSKYYGVYREQSTATDMQNKSLMFGEVVRASLRHHGLKSTLEWAKEIEEPTVRMAIELEAILEAFSEQTTIPTRDISSPRSIVPFQLMWMGC